MSGDRRRDPYGYLRQNDDSSNAVMDAFIASGKRIITYWAENIRTISGTHMTYDTFRRRVGKYLKRKNVALSPFQKERMRMPNSSFQQHAMQYLRMVQSGVVINDAQYFELFVIVPPYDTVPSFEQFGDKLKLFLMEMPPRGPEPEVDMAQSFAGMELETETVAVALETLADIAAVVLTQSSDMELESATDVESITDKESNFLHTELLIARACGGVAIVYRCVQKATGSLGGNGSGGPIYGELTVGSMQAVINHLVRYCNLSPRSRFIDVGSGRGKPNFHVAQDPGVRLSIGIEVEPIRYAVSYMSYC